MIDLEAKYLRWLAACPAARRLDAQNPDDTRKVFAQLYRAFVGYDVGVCFPGKRSL
jgi:hypothetical protein